VVQSKTTLDKLGESKFSIKDAEGNAFKWHAYGNTHHVEILRHKTKKDKYSSHFVTAMEAAQRVRQKMGDRPPLIQIDHGDDWEFVVALHINDLVRIVVDGEEQIHRIQKLNMVNSKIATRLHTSATVNVKSEGIETAPTTMVKKHQLKLLKVNAMGRLFND
jgi:hypothetical protein